MRLLNKLIRALLTWRTHGFPDRVMSALRQARNEYLIARSLPQWRQALDDFQVQKGLKLHIGCGYNAKPGWINIDLFNPEADYRYDIRYGLPFREESCFYVYSEHLFEHFEYLDGLLFLQESFRVLQSGGTFRVVIPDFASAFRAYLEKEKEYFDLLVNARLVNGLDEADITLIDYVNFGVYQRGQHKMLYDAEKLALLLRKVGFAVVRRSAYKLGMDSDAPTRLRYSLYMEAIK